MIEVNFEGRLFNLDLVLVLSIMPMFLFQFTNFSYLILAF